jgi:hypothetical protein
MNILKLVGKSTFTGKAAQTGINSTTKRTFSQVISNKTADVKVRYKRQFFKQSMFRGSKESETIQSLITHMMLSSLVREDLDSE